MTPAAHGQRVAAIMARYAQQRSSLALAALAGARAFRAWDHYPRHDVVDRAHRTEFYFHAHAGQKNALRDHGHFHVFARSAAGHRFHHVVGISITAVGVPQQLFLTNQWVTGEHWVSAKAMAPLVRAFQCNVHGRMAPVAQWITSMVQLYQAEILRLHDQRDAWCRKACRSAASLKEVLADPRYPIIAKKDIALARRLAMLH